LHQGIAQRAFKLSFRLADYIEVKGATLESGLLSVDLVRRIPEAAKPRRVTIGQASAPAVNQETVQPSNTIPLDRKAAVA
jgi:molecular chaperone IbpA